MADATITNDPNEQLYHRIDQFLNIVQRRGNLPQQEPELARQEDLYLAAQAANLQGDLRKNHYLSSTPAFAAEPAVDKA
jgi:hypothetical protein